MYICENQDGFVLLSSMNHRRISVASVIQPYIVLILTEVLHITG